MAKNPLPVQETASVPAAGDADAQRNWAQEPQREKPSTQPRVAPLTAAREKPTQQEAKSANRRTVFFKEVMTETCQIWQKTQPYGFRKQRKLQTAQSQSTACHYTIKTTFLKTENKQKVLKAMRRRGAAPTGVAGSGATACGPTPRKPKWHAKVYSSTGGNLANNAVRFREASFFRNKEEIKVFSD